jgi:rhodanese-related sulfurtransferase
LTNEEIQQQLDAADLRIASESATAPAGDDALAAFDAAQTADLNARLDRAGNVPLTDEDAAIAAQEALDLRIAAESANSLEAAQAAGAVVVDVRTEGEHQAGSIPNTTPIPVDVLREHIDELQGKDVIVTCAVGQRGHTATQILRSHGIKVRNLDGGYTTWRSGMDARERAATK